jgi:dTDP-glucose 4,6-dehydratase
MLTDPGNLANLVSVAKDTRYGFVKGDICDPHSVKAAMCGCDAVVHFAAESHVDRSIDEPAAAIQTNVTGPFVLLQIAKKLALSKFACVSTGEVYGELAPGTFSDENAPLHPISPYSASKASSDLLVRSYVRTYNFPGVTTRASNNYGPYQFPEKFLPLLISNLMEDKLLPIYDDGKQERDWLQLEDYCRAILAVLERGRIGEIFEVDSGFPAEFGSDFLESRA